MAVTVSEVYRVLDEMAPFSLAEEWDNPGILAGSEHQEVTGILCALDLLPPVIDEAVEKGCNLVLTHHPILFHGRKNLREDDAEGRMLCGLVRRRIALIAMHTNFDNAYNGVNDALAQRLGLTNVEKLENGMRLGQVKAMPLSAFADRVESALGGPVRRYGDGERIIRSVALLGGAGGSFAPQALAAGAEVYLTGEIAHHLAWNAYQEGMSVLEAGHGASELPAVELLAKALQKAENVVQWNVRIYESEVELFR